MLKNNPLPLVTLHDFAAGEYFEQYLPLPLYDFLSLIGADASILLSCVVSPACRQVTRTEGSVPPLRQALSELADPAERPIPATITPEVNIMCVTSYLPGKTRSLRD